MSLSEGNAGHSPLRPQRARPASLRIAFYRVVRSFTLVTVFPLWPHLGWGDSLTFFHHLSTSRIFQIIQFHAIPLRLWCGLQVHEAVSSVWSVLPPQAEGGSFPAGQNPKEHGKGASGFGVTAPVQWELFSPACLTYPAIQVAQR